MRYFVVSSIAILVYLLAAYGWGRLAINRLATDNRPGWAFTTVLGLGIWIFLGGILNASHLAYPRALDTILGLGVGFAMVVLYQVFGKAGFGSCFREWRSNLASSLISGDVLLSRWMPVLLALLLFFFLVMTQLPSAAFNYHDDFQTYLPRLVRMLETGSLGGNPFDVLGVDSLGAQAFMQTFFFRYLSIYHVNAFDLVCCFVLCLFVLREIWLSQQTHWIYLLASLTLFVSINPMYVNISSLYSASLMILGAIYSTLMFSDPARDSGHRRVYGGALLAALFLASLVALKMTLVFFAASYFAVYYGLSLLASNKKSGTALVAGFAAAAAVVFIAPWVLLSLANYLSAFQLVMAGEQMPIIGGRGSLFLSSIPTMFSFNKSWWGGYYFAYTLIALSLGVVGLVTAFWSIRSEDKTMASRLITLSASCIAAVVCFMANLHLLDPQTAVRYAIPVLVPVAAVVLLLPWTARRASQTGTTGETSPARRCASRLPGFSVVLAAVLIVALFSQELVARFNRAYLLRTQISFPINNDYVRYNAAALGRSAKTWTASVQNKVEEGDSILALLSVPFHLDHVRNRIFTFTESGILNPWFSIPLGNGPESTREYLSHIGIRYVIHEYHGIGIKQDIDLRRNLDSPYWMFRAISDRSLKFRGILKYLSENSRLIYRDDSVVIFDISQRAVPGPPAS